MFLNAPINLHMYVDIPLHLIFKEHFAILTNHILIRNLTEFQTEF